MIRNLSFSKWQFILLPILLLLSFTTTYGFKQNNADSILLINVNGKVIDPKGTPIAGATVMIRNQKKGCSTNTEGMFSFVSIPENAILMISSVGFENVTVKVKGQIRIEVTMTIRINDIDPIDVYNTGFQKFSRERATGAFATPNEEVRPYRISTDVLSPLEGITPGLSIYRGPLGQPSIAIRGISTIKAIKAPLIVVDNFPYEGNIDNIHPLDIETITILKDAAAASIWGARSGNGVIVITTKKAKYNQDRRITVHANTSVQGRPDIYQGKNFIPAADFIELEKFLFSKGFFKADLSNTTTRPPISPVVAILDKEAKGIITPEEATRQIDILKQRDVRKDLKEYFSQPAITQQYGISLTEGKKDFSYLGSFNYDKNVGSIAGSGFERFVLNGVLNYKLMKTLELTAGISYAQTRTQINPVETNTKTGGPDGKNLHPSTVFMENGQPTAMPKDYNYDWIKSLENTGRTNWEYLPLIERDLANNKATQEENRINVKLKYQPLSWLSMEGMFQKQKSHGVNSIFYDSASYYVRNQINRLSGGEAGNIYYNLPKGHQLDETNSMLSAYNIRAQLNINQIRGRHELVAIAGYDRREIKTGSLQKYLYGYNSNTGTYADVRFDTSYPAFPSGRERIRSFNSGYPGTVNRSYSWYTNMSYTYNNKYMLSASGRIDLANLYGVRANQRATPLGSVGLKWDLWQENFFTAKWISGLQIRSTYGANANRLNGVTAYTTGTMFPATILQPEYTNVNSLGNPDIRWEQIRVLNLGVDIGLFRNRITGNFDFFKKYGDDLLGTQPIASSAGFPTMMTNYADMTGTGVDVTLHTENIRNEHFSWGTFINFCYAKDRVTHYLGDDKILIGKPVSGIFTYKWAGLDPLTGDPQGILNNSASKDYAKLISAKPIEQDFHGPANPTTTIGITNIFRLRSFTLAVNLSGKSGYSFVRSSIFYDGLNKRWQSHEDYLQRWQHPGDEKFTSVPSYSYVSNTGARDVFYNASSILVEKGDHIRINDIQLRYTLNKATLKTPFSDVQLYLNISNIGIIWRANDHHIDPDYQASYSPSRIISFGAKVTI